MWEVGAVIDPIRSWCWSPRPAAHRSRPGARATRHGGSPTPHQVRQDHVVTFRFADARTLAAAECLKPRLAQVARAAVVEAADKRHSVTLEAVPGCAWRLLVQEGLAGPGCVALAVYNYHALFVGTDGRVRSWG